MSRDGLPYTIDVWGVVWLWIWSILHCLPPEKIQQVSCRRWGWIGGVIILAGNASDATDRMPDWSRLVLILSLHAADAAVSFHPSHAGSLTRHSCLFSVAAAAAPYCCCSLATAPAAAIVAPWCCHGCPYPYRRCFWCLDGNHDQYPKMHRRVHYTFNWCS